MSAAARVCAIVTIAVVAITHPSVAGSEVEELMARATHKHQITPSERQFLIAMVTGETLDYSQMPDESRKIRARIIQWVCQDTDAAPHLNRHGLEINGATIEGPLDLSDTRLPFSIVIRHSRIEGNTSFEYSELNRLDLSHTTVNGLLLCDGMTVQGDVNLYSFTASNNVLMNHATVRGRLRCGNARFLGSSGWSLGAEGLTVEGDMSIYGDQLELASAIQLEGARIGGNLTIQSPKRELPDIQARLISVKGDVRIDAHMSGSVTLWSANVNGSFFFHGMAHGIQLDHAKIDRQVVFSRASFDGIVSARNATIGEFVWIKIGTPGKLDLRFARIGILRDDECSWPEKPNLLLNGAIYDLADEAPAGIERIDWLHRQPDIFRPQPFEQLASVFELRGDISLARETRVEKEKLRGRIGRMSSWEKVRHWITGVLVDYGYRPWNATWYLLVLWFIGTILFHFGSELMIKRDTDGKQTFNAVVFALDAMVPLISFYQLKYWLPNPSSCAGRWLRIYFWIHTIIGWALGSVLKLVL